MTPIRNRIKSHRRIRAGELIPHEWNFRAHPDMQRAALLAVYADGTNVSPNSMYWSTWLLRTRSGLRQSLVGAMIDGCFSFRRRSTSSSRRAKLSRVSSDMVVLHDFRGRNDTQSSPIPAALNSATLVRGDQRDH